MSSLVVLSLGQGDLYKGFPSVTLHLGEGDNFYTMKFIGSLPPAPDIAHVYQNWRSLYAAFYQRNCLNSRELDVDDDDDDFEIDEAYVTNISEVDLADLSYQLSVLINAWLSTPEFRNIERQLRTQLKPSEEIRFIVESNDILMRRLPWHLWNFFEDYFLGEVALGTHEYQRPNQYQINTERDKVKILAIFGESTGIDINQDRNFLEQLSHQAEIEFLVEPPLGDLNEQLWEEGWDILFFAGHTSGKDKGLVYINPTDTIAIDQIRFALKQAISRGLKLAIFNSCDSLALAQQLQDLHIPQLIVMREPVPDVVAQDFLKYFLAEFSQGQSLYTAVRFARERLQVLEVNYPCATWLPVICQNPAEAPMIWTQTGIKTQLTGNHQSFETSRNAVPTMESLGVSEARKNYSTSEFNSVYSQELEPQISPIQHHSPRKKVLQTLLLTCLIVTTSIIGVRYFGMLQPWEINAYDHLMQLRPVTERLDERLLVVTIGESDIKYQNDNKMNMRWSLSDEALVNLLQKLDTFEPKAIGLDIYRDSPADKEFPDLVKRLQSDDRFFAVCKVSVSDNGKDGVAASDEIPLKQVGFSDFIADYDDVPRRQLLFLNPPVSSPCASEYAFAYLLARQYLQSKGYKPKFNSQSQLQISDVVFEKLKSHSGGYQQVDAAGYQVLLNYRSLKSVRKIAPTIALTDIIENRIEPATIRSLKNRIILIGVTASSSADYWKTPYSEVSPERERRVPGVFIQAQMTSHILSAVEDKRPFIWWLPGWQEALWIFAWSLLGAILAWRVHKKLYLGIAIAISLLTLFVICLGVFIQAGWIPLIPSALALTASAALMNMLVYHFLGNLKKNR
ncbi:MAG: CHASE2 domain-containing protein [Cyanobacteria bacterium P01_D01_bin.50]